MKKYIFVFLLCGMLVLSLTGCFNQTGSNNQNQGSSSSASGGSSQGTTEQSRQEEIKDGISVGKVNAHAGDENVTVAVSIKNNPGILGATLELTYANELSLVGCSNGNAFNCLTLTKPGKLESPCNFVWDGMSITKDDIQDGEILLLTFNVSGSAKVGTYPIELTYQSGNIIDKDLNPVDLTITNGSIEVVK